MMDHLFAVKATGAAISALVGGLTAGVVAIYASPDTPLIIVVAVGSASAVAFALRRVTSSMISSARETIDGLRAENDRLRKIVNDDHDLTHRHHESPEGE